MTTKEKRLAEVSRHDNKVGHIAVAISILLLVMSSISFGVLYNRSVIDNASINGLKSGYDNTRVLLAQLCNSTTNSDTSQCAQAATQPSTSAQVAKDGRPGTDGRDGLPGIQGVQGIQGLTGATGLQGLMGISTTGRTGTNGIDGAAGSNGTNGIDGTNGLDGTNGNNGADGRGISTVTCAADGNWVIVYSDGASQTASGPCRVDQVPPAPTVDPTVAPTTTP